MAIQEWIENFIKGQTAAAKGAAAANIAVGKSIIGENFYQNRVKDQTNQNIGTNIVTPLEQAIKLRNEEWAREDAIRAETQAREDSTMQRWVEDARKAGINPNLALGASGSPSGGGITSQTGSIDYTMTEAEFNKTYELLMQEIEQNFKGDQAEKDRIANLIKAIITGGALLGGAAIKGAK